MRVQTLTLIHTLLKELNTTALAAYVDIQDSPRIYQKEHPEDKDGYAALCKQRTETRERYEAASAALLDFEQETWT